MMSSCQLKWKFRADRIGFLVNNRGDWKRSSSWRSSVVALSVSKKRGRAVVMESPPEGYRRNVGICLLSPDKKVFTALRINIADTWQMPQGGVDEGEELTNAAIRELREETGVTSAEFLAETPYWFTYDFPLHVKDKLNRCWGTDYKGQAQKWFLFKFTGKDEEINLLGDGSERPEFKDWTWMLPEQVVNFAVDMKKPVYKQVMEIFSQYFQVDRDESSVQKETDAEVPVEI